MEPQKNYAIGKAIGKGADSLVYIAIETSTQEKVAMKVVKIKGMNDKILKRLSNEVEIFKHIFETETHKNVVKFIDFSKTADAIMIITEYIENSAELYKMKSEYFSMERDNILNILNLLHQIADGLEFVHSKNVIHRDLKPQNILVKGYIPIIIDFDLSCVIDQCKNLKAGTPNYLAPEYWRKDSQIDYFKTDIYSLGVLFYFIINNKKVPYKPSVPSVEALENEILNGNPIPSNCGIGELDNLVMSMLSKYATDRPELKEIKEIIESIIKSI
jgi:serine/threonine protein kinase